MKRSDAFPSKFMSKEDVKTPMVLHIGSVELENIGTESNQEEKAVIRWQEPDIKGFIVNDTNWSTIEAAYGDESDNWRGKPVELYMDPSVKYMGKRVGGVRVRIPRDAPAGPPPF